MNRISFMNTTVDNLTMQEAISSIEYLVSKGQPSYVVTPNVDHIVQLEKSKELQNAYQNAALVLTDGKPLIWISKLYGTPIKEKVSGSDLFPRLCELSAQKGFTMFLLGAAEGVAAKAAQNLQKRYARLKIAGICSPPYSFEKNETEIEHIIHIVQKASPDILVLGLGAPKQELFAYHYYKQLQVPVTLCLGASLDFEAGEVKRAPHWMSDHGLEWIYRLCQDPKRLFQRYIIRDSKIIHMVWKYR